MFFYYEKGDPRAVKAPDIMVIKEIDGTYERRTFKLWVEDRVPSVIFEITSDETRRDDAVVKLELYARLGVAEYFLFDPLGEYLDPPLQGHRLEGDRYRPMTRGADDGFESMELGLTVRAVGKSVRPFDPSTGQIIPNGEERAARFIAAESASRDLIEERKLREKLEKKHTKAKQKAERETRK